ANFDHTTFILSPKGSTHHWSGFAAHVERIGQSSTVYVDNPNAFDIVPDLMHEVLHGIAYGFNDQQLATAVGQGVPGNPFDRKVIKANSKNFSNAMDSSCLTK
ncbi:MAG TPA: hypothetical protein VLK33_04035, partial [Terriglobales bacterium]|nr:hypothetical protein [Terriglobales bacterium]